MSVISDLRNKISRLNGKPFVIADINPSFLSSGYQRIYDLVSSGEVVEIGQTSGKLKKSTIYQATDKLKVSSSEKVKVKAKKDLPGLREVFPECFKAPKFKEQGKITHAAPF